MPDLASFVREASLLAFPILLAVTLHELAHGYIADRLGDPTPRLAGRLTGNPLVHLDLVGTLVFLLTGMIGWAKPIPVNSAYFRNPRRGMLWVGAAGPLMNLALAFFFAGCYRALLPLNLDPTSETSLRVVFPLTLIAQAGVRVNLGLCLFNLLPIPPLDGSRVLAGLLPAAGARLLDGLERYGFVILLVLVYSRSLDAGMYPVLSAATGFLLGH
ncbi:MAG: site-2 protease family protein [Deltaproteobacteria bacterium]|nr:site-2 protease family protein [Deltaproteobacteria bacterium]